VFYGLRIQLPLYLKVLEENDFLPAGAFYFPLSSRFTDDAYTHRFIGVFNDDEAVVEAFDEKLKEPGYKSRILDARRNKTMTGGVYPLAKSQDKHTDTAGLRGVAAYAAAVVRGALSEIARGYIAPSPTEKSCGYCPYEGLCGFDPDRDRRRALKKVRLVDLTDACENDERGAAE
jgi:ATP-dependent helicase/DNAse subunit B